MALAEVLDFYFRIHCPFHNAVQIICLTLRISENGGPTTRLVA